MPKSKQYAYRETHSLCLRCGGKRDRHACKLCSECGNKDRERRIAQRAKMIAEKIAATKRQQKLLASIDPARVRAAIPMQRVKDNPHNYPMGPLPTCECGETKARCECGVCFCQTCEQTAESQCSFCRSGDAAYENYSRAVVSRMSRRPELRPARILYSRGGGYSGD